EGERHFGDHDEKKGEEEELAREPQARALAAQIRRSGSTGHVVHGTPAQPKRRSKAMVRRTQTLVRLGRKYVTAARFPISARVGYGTIIPARARMFRPRLIAKVQVLISSPAAAPTVVAPRILPLRSGTTLMWPAL